MLTFVLLSSDRVTAMLILLGTAGLSPWNMGVGYLAGLALWHALQREWLRI